MVHGSKNTAEHFGLTYTQKLNRLKIIFWNLDQLGNPPDKFFQSPKRKATWKLPAGDCSWQEESQSFKVCTLPFYINSLSLLLNDGELKILLCLNSSYRPVIEEVCFLYMIPSAATELHMSLRDVWAWHGRGGIAKWGGVGIAPSSLDLG